MRSYTHTPWPRLAENFKDEGDTLLGLLDCRLAVARNSLGIIDRIEIICNKINVYDIFYNN